MLPSGSNQQTLFNNTASTSNTLAKINENYVRKYDRNECNLIDLGNLNINNEDKTKQLEDIQIKMIEDFLKTSKQQMSKVNHSTSITEAEFQAFFDKHEFGRKPGPPNKLTPEDIQLLETNSNENKQKSQIDQIPEIHTTHDMVLLTSPQITPQKLEQIENHDIDDLVEELMTHQNLEKKLRVEQEPVPVIKENRIPFVLVANERGEMLQNFINSQKANDFNNIFDKILAQNQILRTKEDEKHFPQVKKLTETLATKVAQKSFETNNKREQKALIEELVTKYDIKYLEAVKKVDKLFTKFCNLKSEIEKSKLTLGPSLYEKSVVLPQIMQRLQQRDTAFEAMKSMEMKLILDAAGPSTQKPINVSQISNTIKIKRELFTNPTSLSSPVLVNSTFPTTSHFPKTLISPRILKPPKIANIKPTMSTMLNQRSHVINETKPILSHSSNDPKQTILLNDDLSPSQDLAIPVLKTPELLMEDSNSERLVAHRTHQLFQRLVRGDFH